MLIHLATGNQGKVLEIQSKLAAHSIEVKAVRSEWLEGVEETGSTFVENALIKVHAIQRWVDTPVLADDSGLIIDALDGKPGVRSSRYAGDDATDKMNITQVLSDLSSVPDALRTARFVCVLVLSRYFADPLPLIVQGIWEGKILTSPRGDQGFCYDPIFYVPEKNCSAAELSLFEKNQLSHRGQALSKLMTYLEKPAALTISC